MASVSESSTVGSHVSVLNNPRERNKIVLCWILGVFNIKGNKAAGISNSVAKLILIDYCIDDSRDIWLQANGLEHSVTSKAHQTW